jgi:fatty-acyl-CoA synthase
MCVSTLVHSLVALRGCDLPGLVVIGDDGDTRIRSFAELVAAVEGFAARLVAREVGRGERLAIAAPDPEYMVVATLAALRAGAVPIALADPAGGSAEAWAASALQVVRASGAHRVIRPSPARGSLPALPGARELLVDDLGEHPLGGVFLPEPDSFRADDLALVQFSGGGQIAPRATPYSHAALAAACDALLGAALRARPGDRVLSWIGLHQGLLGAVLAPLRHRVPFVIARPDPFDAARWLRLVDNLGVTITFAGAATLEQPARPDPRLDLRRVRALVCGGDVLALEAVRTFVDVHAAAGLDPRALVPCFGAAASETPGQPLRVDRVAPEAYSRDGFAAPVGHVLGDMSRNALEFVARGRPLPGHRVEVVDRAGEPLGEREVGEVVVCGPSDDPAGRRTGLRGYLAEGRLYVTGRVDDVIVVHGCSYDPQPIEREAARVPGICAGKVVALARPGKLTDELVVIAEGRPVDPAVLNTMTATLRRRIQAALGLRVAALVQVPVGALPRTSSGELQRAAARAQYLQTV